MRTTISFFLCLFVVVYVSGQSNPFTGAGMVGQGNSQQNENSKQGNSQQTGNSSEQHQNNRTQQGSQNNDSEVIADHVFFKMQQCVKHAIIKAVNRNMKQQNQKNSNDPQIQVRSGPLDYLNSLG